MIDFKDSTFVYTPYVDMRKSINGLSMLAAEYPSAGYLSASAFVFINRSKDKIKILVKEPNGFCLLYKRLDRGTFKLNLRINEPLTITKQQLRWLLDGLDYIRLKPLTSPPYSVTF
ncbi:MAG: IS66 family insertion sequence element accessory protein TnpB [bacterium]|nr:IS66 family insertion sequence element accessory protein TnpB [bacterium]